MTQRAFWRTYLADAMTYNAFHGRIWRAKNNRVGRPELYKWDIIHPFAPASTAGHDPHKLVTRNA